MKRLLLLLLALIPFMGINAQEIHFSPKIGLNLSNLTAVEGNLKPGINVGLAVELPVMENFSVEPGIVYSMQGSKSDGSLLKANMDYVNIPIHAKYYIYEGFNIFAGPQFGFNVNGKLKSDLIKDGEDIDIKEAIKAFDFAINIGIGYQFAMGLNVGLQYNVGLTDAFKDVSLEELGDKIQIEGANNRILQINLGWRF